MRFSLKIPDVPFPECLSGIRRALLDNAFYDPNAAERIFRSAICSDKKATQEYGE